MPLASNGQDWPCSNPAVNATRFSITSTVVVVGLVTIAFQVMFHEVSALLALILLASLAHVLAHVLLYLLLLVLWLVSLLCTDDCHIYHVVASIWCGPVLPTCLAFHTTACVHCR